jgi:hypothetical protein
MAVNQQGYWGTNGNWFNPNQQLGNQYGGGFDYLDPMNAVSQGMGTMGNLGNTIGNSFGFANLLNSQNRQAQYQPEAQMTTANINGNANQNIANTNAQAAQNIANTNANARTQQISSLMPLITALIGNRGVGGGGAGLQGFTTNFGQGAAL